MPAVSLFVFLDTNCPGWRNRQVDLVNRRLRQLGRRTVTFSHRGGSISGGVVQLLDCNPHDALFFYENAWISVATYFYVRYGESVTSLNRIAFVKVTPTWRSMAMSQCCTHWISWKSTRCVLLLHSLLKCCSV